MPSRPLRILIVDDEPLARERIADLLAHEENVDIAGTADNGRAAVDAIQDLRPDLVFLDVQMPGLTGLEVARAVGADRMPATIFVTAFDQHALQAFDLAAVDYLVKPFDDERFEQALARARRVVSLEETRRIHERLLTVLNGGQAAGSGGAPAVAATRTSSQPEGEVSAAGSAPSGDYLERFAVESRGKVQFVNASSVDYIQASGPYAELVTGTNRYLIRESMQALYERLDPRDFVRIHRSTIVQLDRVDTLLRGPGGDYALQLKNGTRLRVSRSRREDVARRLGIA
jgi:two-component system LytT family response regulator